MINYCRKSTDMVILLSQRGYWYWFCVTWILTQLLKSEIQPNLVVACVMVWLTFVGLVQQIIQSTPCGLKALDIMSAETVVLPLISVTCLIFFILWKDRPIKVSYCQKIIIVPTLVTHSLTVAIDVNLVNWKQILTESWPLTILSLHV